MKNQMKNKYLLLSLLAGNIFFTTSCSDLEDPNYGALPLSSYFKTDADAEKVLIGMYDELYKNYTRPWSSAYFIKILPSDDGGTAFSATDQANLHQFDDFKLDAGNPHVNDIWTGFYNVIGAANLTIDNISKNNLPLKDELNAEAKFLRAHSYFELVNMFGGVPLNLVPVYDINKRSDVPRSSVAEVYAQIEKDLKDAVQYGRKDKSFRASTHAAKALLGKVYLYQKKYAEASALFSDVINSGVYSLEPNFKTVWSRAGENGKESIFEVCLSSLEGYQWAGVAVFPWGGRPKSNIHQQLMGPRTGNFKNLDKIGVLDGWGFNTPTKKIGDLFYSENETVRKEATLISEADAVSKGVVVADPNMHDYDKYIRLKYATYPTETDMTSQPEVNFGTNWRLFRYADLLLMAAEAYQKIGKETEARVELNKVRKRAEMPEIQSSVAGDNLFEAIVKERQLELAFEGHRFFDLKRWNKANKEVLGNDFSDKSLLFPIPLTEMQKNKVIGTQNPGY